MTNQQTNILETERLILRQVTSDDLDALFALYRDPEVRKYFPDGTRTYEQDLPSINGDGIPTLIYSMHKRGQITNKLF